MSTINLPHLRPTAGPTTAAVAVAPPAADLPRLRLSTPALLRLMLGTTWALSALFLLAAGLGLERHRHAIQTIGKDTAPSIIAAQHIRTSLAWAHADAARGLGGDPDARSAYDNHRRQAADEMVAAAENITYGDAERAPIRRLVDGFGRYGAAVATARARASSASPAALVDADRILHVDLLPDADALDKANRDALELGYATERAGAGRTAAGAAAAGVVLVAGLVGTQMFLARRMRRLLNPPLLLATGAAIAMSVWLVAAMSASAEHLRSAKADAFDSISALTQARAVAVDAYATQMVGADTAQVVADGDRIARPAAGDSWARVLTIVDAGSVPDGLTGYLADELRNITFVGERDAATDALRTYAAYRFARPADAAAAFARFDAALGKTLDINQAAFDASVGAGFDALAGLWAWAAATAVGVAVAAYLGLRPRLREYAA